MKRRRASVMLEFALVLPFMLFLLAFTIDMGRMVYAAHAAQQAVSETARQSAVFGAAGMDGNHASPVPASRSTVVAACTADRTSCVMGLFALQTALADTPGGQMLQNWQLSVTQDVQAKFGRVCSADTPTIRVQVAYDIDWLTPGMNGLLNMAGTGSDQSSGTLQPRSMTSTATARCEVETATPTGAG